MNPQDELARLGITRAPGEALFFFDFSAYPVSDDELLLDASLSAQPDRQGMTINFGEVSVLNHRYPNKYYTTMSQKFGRKVCKTGCIAKISHAVLAEARYLNLSFGLNLQDIGLSRIPQDLSVIDTRNDYVKACHITIPVRFVTTDDNPCIAVTVRVNPHTSDCTYFTYKSTGSGSWNRKTWSTNQAGAEIAPVAKMIELIAPVDENEDVITFDKTMEITGTRIENVILL